MPIEPPGQVCRHHTGCCDPHVRSSTPLRVSSGLWCAMCSISQDAACCEQFAPQREVNAFARPRPHALRKQKVSTDVGPLVCPLPSQSNVKDNVCVSMCGLRRMRGALRCICGVEGCRRYSSYRLTAAVAGQHVQKTRGRSRSAVIGRQQLQ